MRLLVVLCGLCIATAVGISGASAGAPEESGATALGKFPFTCFRIGDYPDVISLNYSTTDAYGERIYTGQSLLNGQFYAGAYAHIQNGTGYVHVVLTYTGRATNRTRALLALPGGSGGEGVFATYLLDLSQYDPVQPAAETTLTSCADEGFHAMETLPYGSGEEHRKVEVQSKLGDAPTPYGQYCVYMGYYSGYPMYMNVTSTGSGFTGLVLAEYSYSDMPYAYGGGLLTDDGALFMLNNYLIGGDSRIISAFGTSPGPASYSTLLSFGYMNGQANDIYLSVTNEGGLLTC